MKSYPKIIHLNNQYLNLDCIAFNKIDGSNFRGEFSRKRKCFYKFGTRNVMIDKSDEQFGDAIDIFINKYGEDLSKIFYDKYPKIDKIVVFGEYSGENSFAGRHIATDKKDIVIFDISLHKFGFILPNIFIEQFGHLDIPKVIYEGPFSKELIQKVKNNQFNLKEGIIAKGIIKNKNNKDEGWVTKVKTNEWLQKVKSLFGEKEYLENLI